jgi:hypothetical protein
MRKLELFDSDYTLALKMEDYRMLKGVRKKLEKVGGGDLVVGDVRWLVEEIDGVLKRIEDGLTEIRLGGMLNDKVR